MTNLQAAIGLAQVENFQTLIKRRINNARKYMDNLRDRNEITFQPCHKDVKNVFWMFAILLNEHSRISRDDLRMKLAEDGIETRSFFIPIHLQPVYYNSGNSELFPISEYLCKNGMYLPSSGNLKEEDINYITDKIIFHLGGY